MIKYPKIETLFERDKNTFKISPIPRKKESVLPLFDLKEVIAEEKIDGTNSQLEIKVTSLEIDTAICSRNNIIGKLGISPSEGTQKLFKQIVNTINKIFDYKLIADFLFNNFSQVSLERGLEIRFYGETYGEKIQANGYTKEGTDFRLFDVSINGRFVSIDTRNNIASELKIEVVPKVLTLVDLSYENLYEKLFKTHSKSIIAKNNGIDSELEGYILRPRYALYNNNERVITKIKRKDFV